MMDDLKSSPTTKSTEKRRPLIYLACPYSDPSPLIRHGRFQAATRAAVMLMTITGEPVFSPITHSHHLGLILDESNGWFSCDWPRWERLDLAILAVCHKLCILPMPGWKESVGLLAEQAAATKIGIPIEVLDDVFCTGIVSTKAPATNERR